MIPVLLLVSLIVYSIVNLTPGDIARTILGAEAPESAVEQLREEMGLDKPMIVRFFLYIKDVILKGDLVLPIVQDLRSCLKYLQDFLFPCDFPYSQ